MSNEHNENSAKLKRTLRTRCESDLVKRALDFAAKMDRSESYLVRKAVEEYLDRHAGESQKQAA